MKGQSFSLPFFEPFVKLTLDLQSIQTDKAVTFFFSVAISEQLNAAPYPCGVHECFLQPLEETACDFMCALLLFPDQLPCQTNYRARPMTVPDQWLCQTNDCACQTNDCARPMTLVFGLGTRLHVCIRTRLENGVLHNRQHFSGAVNSFIDWGKFEGIKMLSCRRALH